MTCSSEPAYLRLHVLVMIVASLFLAALSPSPIGGVDDTRDVAGDSRSPSPKQSPSLQLSQAQKAKARKLRTHSARTRREQSRLAVRSNIALVEDANTLKILLEKKATEVVPIASITKLMTAIVVLDANLPLQEKLTISDADLDMVKRSYSRLHVGWSLSREDMLHLALMASENRAASALSRNYPGGRPAFIAAMNASAARLGMNSTRFVSPNGLTSENVSTAYDLAKLVQAAYEYPLIREFSTDPVYSVRIGKHILQFVNSNRLIGRSGWDIELQKTGFINESGDCMVMWTNVDGRPLIMVFLDAFGKLTRFADARRVRTQLSLAQAK